MWEDIKFWVHVRITDQVYKHAEFLRQHPKCYSILKFFKIVH